jgi:hypothetical protein
VSIEQVRVDGVEAADQAHDPSRRDVGPEEPDAKLTGRERKKERKKARE